MKHSIIVKFLMIVVCCLSLVAAVGCTAGIVALESANLYITGLDALQDQAYDSIAKDIATGYAELYAAETLGDLPYTLRESLYDDPLDRSDTEHWYVKLEQDGRMLSSDGIFTTRCAYSKQINISPLYSIASLYSPEDMIPSATVTPDPTTPTTQAQESQSTTYPQIQVPDGYLYYRQELTLQSGGVVTYYLYYYQAPQYTVTVRLQEGVLDNSSLYLLNNIYPHRYTFIAGLIASLLMSSVALVYLVYAAGKSADGSIRPGGLNLLPLDLYACITIGSITALAVLLRNLLEWMEKEGPHLGNLSLIGVNLLGIVVVFVAFFFAFCAQIKVKGNFWWRHSVLGCCCRIIGAGFRLLGKGIAALTKMLPLMGQWLLIAAAMGLSLLITFLLWLGNRGSSEATGCAMLFFLNLFVCIGVVIHGSYCYATLLKGVQRMCQGDLSHQIPTRYLWGNFRIFAQDLNALSQAAQTAAQQQMRSERMRTELITNVSHDIKTPLTSIINFVDLLQKPHSETQQQEYLEVLARQSSQMKKLIEDLMELSKASSGNISVHLQQLDAAQAIYQALGEFSDKLDAAQITPVFRAPAQPLLIMADGRLMWRVLFNLLTNAVKYALPGTRLYLDLLQAEDRVVLSLKNVSRTPLNMDAQDLLERFVRGDASRKSEGSGLGLNIAKGLMEVQGGGLELLIDGDLFKVTLNFLAAKQ